MLFTKFAMSKEFIKRRVGSDQLEEAVRQQRQLSYFTQSEIQQDLTQSWWDNWATNGYISDNDFLNWVRLIFKADNFCQFTKYLRYPLPSSKLIKQKVKPELARVFFSEDSFFKYSVKGIEIEDPLELDSRNFSDTLFNKLLFNHNDIIVHDLFDTNKAIRHFVSIDHVVAIESHDSNIHRIAFSASVRDENNQGIDGFAYMDSKEFVFYDKDFKNEPIIRPHDLGFTPANYISSSAFKDKDVVRTSIFSELREELEEYTFLKTLQKMTEPNGSIPIITKLKTKENDVENKVNRSDQDPGAGALSATKLLGYTEIQNQSDKILEAGSVISVPGIRSSDGSINMDVVSNFLNFFYLPVEAMEYVKTRLKEIETNIIVLSTGDFFEPNQAAQNELQISKSYISRQDNLRHISRELSIARNKSDTTFLSLENGTDNVTVDGFFGSDFFLETQQDLYDMVAKSPNPIESKTLLIRLAKNRSRFNKERGERDVILYKFLPYAVDEDFEKAIDKQAIDDITFQYQTRFNYWVNLFESQFGDILAFWNMLENSTEAEKFVLINNLIVDIIEENGTKTTTISPPEVV